MHRDRGQCVLAAGRVEPATRRQDRTYPPTVRDDRSGDHATDRRRGHKHRWCSVGHSWRRCIASWLNQARVDPPSCRPSRRGQRRGRSASAAPRTRRRRAAGSTRTTTSVPGASRLSSARMRWRSRRRTLLRVTAGPTARDTTKPALGEDAWPDGAVRQVHDQSAAAGSPTAPDDGGEVVGPPQALVCREHGQPRLDGSGREAIAPLGAPRGDDGAAGPGAHAQPEAVGLRAPAVVRLERALAHCRRLPYSRRIEGGDLPLGAR